MDNNNLLNSLRQLGQMGEQIQKMFGTDFLKNMQVPGMNLPNVPGAGGIPGIPGMSGTGGVSGMSGTDAGFPFQNMFGMGAPVYPRADVYQTKNEVVAVLEIPGLENKGDVKVNVEPTRLVVKGNPSIRYSNVAKDQFVISERQSSFQREIDLPVRVRANKVRALYKNGLLEVHMIKDIGQAEGTRGNYVNVQFEERGS